ncbi:MAG: Eco57I restriction-modification methylase domain-containing protein, partial [Anaerolineae bacterium]
MSTTNRARFVTVKTEGALLPADLLQRIAAGEEEGLAPTDYHLGEHERVKEAISRAWSRCLGAWQVFAERRAILPPGDPGTTLTRERWLLILFQELGYGRLPAARTLAVDGQNYPVSHLWGRTPLHLVGCGQCLDAPFSAPGLPRRSPHSLMQELLNRSSEHLWGIVSNGLHLRLLRDNKSLTRAAYLQFDLLAMMTDQVYADFALLWLVCHESRVAGEEPAACWLERWCRAAAERGT